MVVITLHAREMNEMIVGSVTVTLNEGDVVFLEGNWQ
jgi:hypothetical protein